MAWYCALKLEMAVHLTKALLTEQLRSADVPGLEAAKAKLKEDLERKCVRSSFQALNVIVRLLPGSSLKRYNPGFPPK